MTIAYFWNLIKFSTIYYWILFIKNKYNFEYLKLLILLYFKIILKKSSMPQDYGKNQYIITLSYTIRNK